MMALTPIYEGDVVLIQLEREQELREWLDRRREELMDQNRQIEEKLTKSGEIDVRNATRDRPRRRDN